MQTSTIDFGDDAEIELEAIPEQQLVADAAVADTQRNEAIDVVRLFAAAGIVLAHAGESEAFGLWGNLFRFGVPFFLFASLFYQSASLRRNPDKTLMQFIFARTKRLYVPFLAWSAIYLVVRDVKRVGLLHVPPVWPQSAMLWTGSEYHLWFLPFLLICSIILAVLHRALFRYDPRLQWPAIGIAVGLGIAIVNRSTVPVSSVYDTTFNTPTYALDQWLLALPAASWAFAFAWFTNLVPEALSFPQLLAIAGIALATWCSVKQALYGIQLAPRGLTGFGCMLAALFPWRGKVVMAMARTGRMSYGIYLCHVIPVEILHVISHRLNIAPSSGVDAITFVLAFAASVGIVSLLSKSRWLAWLNG